jgi:hydrogenase nickel incorporation protein HypB
VLFIESVGDLACPSLLDRGEAARVVVASVTEGEDKPIKHPHAFRSAHVLLVTKRDLAGHVEFDAPRFTTFAREVNPSAVILPLSARTGEGMARWYDWLRAARVAVSRAGSRSS